MEKLTVIGIDPGKSGAIAVATNGTIEIHKMPFNAVGLAKLFKPFDPENTIVFIEKVSAFVGEDNSKKYAIIKMLEQVKELKTVLELYGLTYVEVASQTWQSGLGLRFKKMEKKDRKQKYYEYAQRFAYKNKVLKYQGDAVCILALGIKLVKEQDPLVSFENMKQTDKF